MTATGSEMPRAEIRRRMDETLQQLEEQGPPTSQPGEIAAPPPPRRRNWLLFIGLGLVIAAELAVLGVVARMENLEAAPAVAKTPCESALAVIETGVIEYREAHGQAPATLEQLVPDYLPGVPRPSGAVVQYQSQGEGFSLRCDEVG